MKGNIFTTYKQVESPKPKKLQPIIEKPKDFDLLDFLLPAQLLTTKSYDSPQYYSEEELYYPYIEDVGDLETYTATYLPVPTVSAFNTSELLSLDIEDLLRSEGITSINGKLIRFGNKNLRAANASYGVKNSNHKRRDPHTGYAMARDISIIGGTNQDYSDFRSALLSNPKVVLWFDAKGWGIINEITPAILSKTRGTGRHFHFGPDKWAQRTWRAWVSNPNLPITQSI